MTFVDDDLIQQQVNYYRARAEEYDRYLQPICHSGAADDRAENPEWQQAIDALLALGPRRRVLELAGGTGIWTKELRRIAAELTVLDASPEMLVINRARLNDPSVSYVCVDLFNWTPQQEYDLVFFAFWLSHVPPDRLPAFLDRLLKATAPEGHIFIVDEPAGGRMVSGPARDGMFQTRSLQDGRTFEIIKMYYDPLRIQAQMEERGFALVDLKIGEEFFHMASVRQK